jgi:signal recognition particle subunit SRP68
MHMKSTHSADTAPKGITGSTRRHIISRLHKAVTYAEELVRLLGDRETTGASGIDILEARAYSSCLSGAMEFEKQGWEGCLRFYSEARIIYETLTASTKKDIFRDLLSTAIDPSIRYSAYQRQLPRTIAIPTIARRYFPRSDSELVAEIEKLDPDALNEPSREKRGSAVAPDNVPKTITWRSRTVTLEDASIALALAAVSTASENLSTFLSSPENSGLMPKEKAAAYDDVLTASQDAVDATKRAIDELITEGVGQGDKRMQGLQVTRTAVNYALVGWRVGRNRVLSGEHDGVALESGTAKKSRESGKGGQPHAEKGEGRGRKLAGLRERVALYDATLQVKKLYTRSCTSTNG